MYPVLTVSKTSFFTSYDTIFRLEFSSRRILSSPWQLKTIGFIDRNNVFPINNGKVPRSLSNAPFKSALCNINHSPLVVDIFNTYSRKQDHRKSECSAIAHYTPSKRFHSMRMHHTFEANPYSQKFLYPYWTWEHVLCNGTANTRPGWNKLHFPLACANKAVACRVWRPFQAFPTSFFQMSTSQIPLPV